MEAGESRESFIRWQAILREQLGYAVNLIFTFSTASLGYSLVLLKDTGLVPVGLARSLFWCAVALFSLSVAMGTVGVVTRLNDFRGTAARARARLDELPPGRSREFLVKLGKATWWCFYVQIAAFTFGALALGVSLFRTYASRIT